MPATRFILVRHGETEWNLQEREMGQLDSPLTPLGLEQARRLGETEMNLQEREMGQLDSPLTPLGLEQARRLGETEWNLQEREMGQLDSPLTPLGLEQARRLGARLAQIKIDRLYSSDLPRAARTAAIIAEQTGHAVVFDVRLRERNMGIFQGLTAPEM